MVIFFTGHRPQRLGGFDPLNPIASWARDALVAAISRAHATGKVVKWISGGALYTDQWAIAALLDLQEGSRIVVARPFPNQHIKWSYEGQRYYLDMLNRVEAAGGEVVDISPDPFTVEKMHVRDRWEVDQSTHGIAVWNGDPSGTGHTVAYAREKRCPFYHIDPKTRTCVWELPQ